MGETDTLKKWINESNYIVFFGGAGVSTESNIPDFRSTDGLYHQENDYPPETILSHSFYMRKPEEFYRFYRNKMLFPNAKPNRAHLALAKLEQEGKLKAVITQNIDGLHQAAGSKEVLELHGSVLRNHCTRCGRFYGLDDILKMKGVPKCGCGGVIKPDVVLYEEGLDNEVIERSIAHIRKADMLIILTAVEKVAVNFGKENEKWLDDLTVSQARKYIEEGQFAAGSMLPKVQACVDFASSGTGRTAMITLLEKAKDGIMGKTGTQIHL